MQCACEAKLNLTVHMPDVGCVVDLIHKFKKRIGLLNDSIVTLFLFANILVLLFFLVF